MRVVGGIHTHTHILYNIHVHRERRQILSLQRCGHPIRQIWTTAMRYTSREGLPFAAVIFSLMVIELKVKRLNLLNENRY